MTATMPGAAAGSAVNLALPNGTDDSGWLRAFTAVVPSVLRAFRQYQKRLAGARERSLTTGADLPDEPSVVSYLVAAAMMLDTPTKQRLLQAPDTASRLRDELKLLRSETAIIRNLPSLPAADLTRGRTSLN